MRKRWRSTRHANDTGLAPLPNQGRGRGKVDARYAMDPPAASFSVLQRAGGLVRVAHPAPSAMYMRLMALPAPIAAFSAHRMLSIDAVVRLVLAMGCAQAAIGILNDYWEPARSTRRRGPKRARSPGQCSQARRWRWWLF